MVNSVLSVLMALLVALTCSVHSEETAHETGLQSADFVNSNGDHHPQKRMALNNPSEAEEEMYLREYNPDDVAAPEESMDKRGSLFRFGKRGGSLFRFGKRGSLFRFGKRQGGTLFRFGKRGGGTLFRFGRSGPAEYNFDGLRESDADLVRKLVAQSEYAYNQDGETNKRGIDSFHWGSDSEK